MQFVAETEKRRIPQSQRLGWWLVEVCSLSLVACGGLQNTETSACREHGDCAGDAEKTLLPAIPDDSCSDGTVGDRDGQDGNGGRDGCAENGSAGLADLIQAICADARSTV